MKFLSTITTCTVALASCIGILDIRAAAQEQEDVQIEIVDQNGEKVKASQLDLPLPGPPAANAKDGVFSFTTDSGKITVVEADGTKREIDITGAKSIIVNQSVRSTIVDGQEKKESFGKAIIVGPDGTRQEIELAPGQHAGQLRLFDFNGLNPGGWDQVRAGQAKNSYMIGVNCSPVSELLSKQLRLQSNTGLVVDAVSNDSPSQTAGIEKHDILMFADDGQLSTIANLTEAVQLAGEEKTKLSLRLLRAGKEIGIEVSPIERPAGSFGVFKMQGEVLPPNIDFQFRRMAPGIIMAPNMHGGNQQIEEQMKAVREQMEQLRQEIRENFEKDKL